MFSKVLLDCNKLYSASSYFFSLVLFILVSSDDRKIQISMLSIAIECERFCQNYSEHPEHFDWRWIWIKIFNFESSTYFLNFFGYRFPFVGILNLFTNTFQRVEMLVRSCYGSSLKFFLLSVWTGPRVQGLSSLDGVPDKGNLP